MPLKMDLLSYTCVHIYTYTQYTYVYIYMHVSIPIYVYTHTLHWHTFSSFHKHKLNRTLRIQKIERRKKSLFLKCLDKGNKQQSNLKMSFSIIYISHYFELCVLATTDHRKCMILFFLELPYFTKHNW